MLLQSTSFYLVTVYGHAVNTLNSNADDIFTERVDNRHNEIASLLASKWNTISFYSDAVNKLYQSYSADNDIPLYADTDKQKEFLADASPTLFNMIRANSVNGVFIILTDSEKYKACSEEEQSYYGLCIRDYDSSSAYSNKEDLLVERSPSSLNAMLGCPLDSSWEAHYTFSKTGDSGDYFYKPLEQAYKNPGVEVSNFKYLSSKHTYSNGGRSVISYSMPLIYEDTVYGVIGIELTDTYLSSLLPSSELQGKSNGAYALVKYKEDSTEHSVVASDGVLFQRCFGDDEKLPFERNNTSKSGIYEYSKNEVDVCLYENPIKIYNVNTPFENEKFVLVGIVLKDGLYEVSRQVRNTLMFVACIVLFFGSAAILIVSHLLSRPIKKLAKSTEEMRPDDDTNLQHIHIKEIDQLVDAIAKQNITINQTRVRTEFLSRMSHDMRTPMNAIIGFSSPEALDGCSKEQLDEYLEKINGSGKYLLGLINEVLDMTKIDSGKMELESNVIEMDNFLETTVYMIEELCEKRQIRFVKQLPPGEGICFIGDKQRLSQIVVNLLSNAVKFTPKNGTVTFSVQKSMLSDTHITYIFTVKDTGIGMSREFQAKMYEPFIQEHSGKEGTGLGLTIVQQLVTLMDGTIECISEKNAGTEFNIQLTFPLCESAATGKTGGGTAQPADKERIAKALAGKRILLCEDHPLNQQIATRLLTRMGVTVEIANDGKQGTQAFEKSEENDFDAILMDIRMPEMDGLQATRYIRSLNRPDAKKIPIIAMTANAFVEDVEATSAAGMNEHLSKPIDPQKLYQTLAKYFI